MGDSKQEIEAWFTMYSNDLYNFLVYYLGHYDVEDLVQDVFIKAIAISEVQVAHTSYDQVQNLYTFDFMVSYAGIPVVKEPDQDIKVYSAKR